LAPVSVPSDTIPDNILKSSSNAGVCIVTLLELSRRYV
jgi:hypothetical protein